jgi:hypothetical protein
MERRIGESHASRCVKSRSAAQNAEENYAVNVSWLSAFATAFSSVFAS